MNVYAADLWARAKDSLVVAQHLTSFSPDAAASRAYYAAFYAVSALLAAEGKSFTKHSAVEAAVHAQLVKPGRWPVALGRDYSALRTLRAKGDYGAGEHVTREEAEEAAQSAQRMLEAIQRESPAFDLDFRTNEEPSQ